MNQERDAWNAQLAPEVRRQLAEVRERVLATATRVVKQELHADPPATQASRTAAAAVVLAEDLARLSPARGEWACERGCSWCCHQWVSVTPAEAIGIAESLREAFPDEWMPRLRGLLASRCERIATMTGFADYERAQLPCAFLAGDGACGIYEWRPVMCRSYHSLDRRQCAERHADGGVGEVTLDSVTIVTGRAVINGVKIASEAVARDGAFYEMHSAVLCALDAPDAGERWARGEAVFAACTRSPTRGDVG